MGSYKKYYKQEKKNPVYQTKFMLRNGLATTDKSQYLNISMISS